MPAWTPEETLKLIFAVSDVDLKAPWATLEKHEVLPPGRTLEACKLQFTRPRST